MTGTRLAIPPQLYWSYCWAAVGQDARATAAEIRYFLPRVLAASVAGESPALWEAMVARKVGFAEPGIYTAAELELVRDFARTLVTHLCHHAEPSPPDETHLGEIIAGLVCGGLGVTTELLALWRGHGAAPLARAHYAAMTADLPPTRPRRTGAPPSGWMRMTPRPGSWRTSPPGTTIQPPEPH